MPQDNRRFNGPDDSVSYMKYTKDYVKRYDELHAELLNDKQLRKDWRLPEEGRSVYMFFAATDMLSQAKGSAYVEMKTTKVVCAVFDPREIPGQSEFSQLGEIFCEVKFAPFSCYGERRTAAPDDEEKALSVALRQALEPCVCRDQFPNYQIDVFVYILEDDGSCLAAAINAAGLALANAAVPIYDLITSCSLAVIENQIFIDPNREEERLAISSPESNTNHGLITVSTLSEMKQVSDYRQIGSMDIECVTNALDILEEECAKILPLIQKVLVRNVAASIQQKVALEEESKKREALMKANVEEWKKLLNDE